jgi:hypothetical protein
MLFAGIYGIARKRNYFRLGDDPLSCTAGIHELLIINIKSINTNP